MLLETHLERLVLVMGPNVCVSVCVSVCVLAYQRSRAPWWARAGALSGEVKPGVEPLHLALDAKLPPHLVHQGDGYALMNLPQPALLRPAL